jgi:hypothetical protein
MQAENKTQILVAVIGLLGVLGGAVFGNWDKIFKPSPAQTQSSPPAASSLTSTPSVSLPTAVTPAPVTPVATPSVVPASKPTIVPTKPAADPSIGVPSVDIDGFWVDQNGISYEITQNNPGYFELIVTDGSTTTYGSGTISGRNIRLEYQNQNGSTGFGTGVISSNEAVIRVTLSDSGSGKFQITLRPQ